MGGPRCCPNQVYSPDLYALLPPLPPPAPEPFLTPSLAESPTHSLPPTLFGVAQFLSARLLDRALQEGWSLLFIAVSPAPSPEPGTQQVHNYCVLGRWTGLTVMLTSHCRVDIK